MNRFIILHFFTKVISLFQIEINWRYLDTKADRDPRSIYCVMCSLFDFFIFEVIFLLFRFEFFHMKKKSSQEYINPETAKFDYLKEIN